MQKLNRQTTPKENDIHEKISELSLILSGLEERKKDLDAVISNHEGNKVEYIKLQSQLEEINKVITELRSTIINLGIQISKLTELKNTLSKENSLLDTQIEEKNKVVTDVEIHKVTLKILQKKIMDFNTVHSNQKKIAEKELSDIKEKVKSIQSVISTALNK